MAVRHSTHAMIRCLCEWWKYRAKTLAWGGAGTGASIARRIYRIVWLRAGIAVSVAECFYGLGTGALIDCLFMLSTTCLHVYDHTSSRPNLPEPYRSLSASTCDHATPALVYFRRASRVALLSTDVRWPITCIPGRPLWGRAPRWNIKTDLTPRAAATISRVRMGFRC